MHADIAKKRQDYLLCTQVRCRKGIFLARARSFFGGSWVGFYGIEITVIFLSRMQNAGNYRLYARNPYPRCGWPGSTTDNRNAPFPRKMLGARRAEVWVTISGSLPLWKHGRLKGEMCVPVRHMRCAALCAAKSAMRHLRNEDTRVPTYRYHYLI